MAMVLIQPKANKWLDYIEKIKLSQSETNISSKLGLALIKKKTISFKKLKVESKSDEGKTIQTVSNNKAVYQLKEHSEITNS